MAKDPAVLLAPNIWRIPVAPSDGVNTFALRGDDGQVTLIDTGLEWTWKKLVEGLAFAKIDLADVTKILITHAHGDHVGNVNRVLESSSATVLAPLAATPYLESGKAPSIDPKRRFRKLLEKRGGFDKVQVQQTFVDGELLDAAGGIRAMHTPGHTPGHTSLIHEPSGILFTGDVVHFWRKQIRIGMALVCHDMALNEVSAQRLSEATSDVLAFSHGPHVAANGRQAIHTFLASRSTQA